MLTKKEAIEFVGKARAKNRFGDELGGLMGMPNLNIESILAQIYGGGDQEIRNTIRELETKEYNRLRLEFLKQNKEREKKLAKA